MKRAQVCLFLVSSVCCWIAARPRAGVPAKISGCMRCTARLLHPGGTALGPELGREPGPVQHRQWRGSLACNNSAAVSCLVRAPCAARPLMQTFQAYELAL
jgi:hypothetical protein